MENDETPNEILPWLFLGSRHSRVDPLILNSFKIKAVLDLSGLENNPKFDGIEYLEVSLEDNEETDILSVLESCHSFIHSKKDSGAVLVHCNLGISRSATIILSLLMDVNKMTLYEAWKYTKNRRRIIKPNTGFLRQLIEYEKKRFGKTTLNLGKYGQLYWVSNPE
eukprot:TRINITY_DN1254_c0_g2_i1.p1 TRINITY_DN1254_c0_g2~~TRINITY_DN1254_c0_g2_i1.p1  ORF type:complete len:166 (-),score=17.26 TRINITY_DN1254_c0_g2_i1:23-520(-)